MRIFRPATPPCYPCALLHHAPHTQSNSMDYVTPTASGATSACCTAGDSATPPAMVIRSGLPTRESAESMEFRCSALPATPQTHGTAPSSHDESPCPGPLPAINPTRLAQVTPLQAVSPGTMATPEAERTYTHVSVLILN